MQRGRLGAQEPIGPVGEIRPMGDTKGAFNGYICSTLPTVSYSATIHGARSFNPG
jgi:hypothetical protein